MAESGICALIQEGLPDACPDNADMQKAILDMHKDKVLQRYQYFVGSTQYFEYY